jgi:hypothetical protein
VLGGAAIVLAVILPMAVVSIGAGIPTLVLLRAVTGALRSSR